ncbi:hypothetical protein [Kocuria palustris]|uniref:hypothetical protein n=1 Tax=Kocuria palustris TaxID=71999 RepID=UPI003CF1D479
MKAAALNEIAALPPWIAGYEMARDDVAVLTFAERDDAMQISSSAIVPMDQIDPADFDESARYAARQLMATNGDTTPVVFVIGHGDAGDMLADRLTDGLRPELPNGAEVITLHNDGAEVAVEMLNDLAHGHTDDVETTRSRLAALLSTDDTGWTQERVMMAAITSQTPAMSDELRRLYVQAPPQDQQAIASPLALAALVQQKITQPLRALRPQIDENGPSSKELIIIDALAADVTDPQRFQTAMGNRQEHLLAEGVPAQRDALWQQDHPSPQRPAQTPPSKPTTPSPDPRPEDLPPTTGPAGPGMS